jgi:hypothetical protein
MKRTFTILHEERGSSHTYETYKSSPGFVWVDGRKTDLREGREHYKKMIEAGFKQVKVMNEACHDFEDMEHWNDRMIERRHRRETDDPFGYG